MLNASPIPPAPNGVHVPNTVPSGAQMQITPSTVAEIVPCLGAETVARVGTQCILLCDILPQAKREAYNVFKERFDQASELEKSLITEEEKNEFLKQATMMRYGSLLEEQIQFALLYNDFATGRKPEEIAVHERQYSNLFDSEEIPKMLKEFGAEDVFDLNRKLRSVYGSSLDRERHLYIHRMLAIGWLMASSRTVEGGHSYDEMLEYYNANTAEFETKGRARWQELYVSFANHPNEKAAWDKIAWMGDQVLVRGASFEQIAKEHSDGLTASKGGHWDWVKRGELVSTQLENAIFSQPVGKMGVILRERDGFHIVLVAEREETRRTPFTEAQVVIREKIRQRKLSTYQAEHFEALRKQFPVHILKPRLQL